MSGFTIDSRLITPVNWQIPGTEESCRILSVLWVRRLRAVLEADLPVRQGGAGAPAMVQFCG